MLISLVTGILISNISFVMKATMGFIESDKIVSKASPNVDAYCRLLF